MESDTGAGPPVEDNSITDIITLALYGSIGLVFIILVLTVLHFKRVINLKKLSRRFC